jgi:hypothetical protein
VAVLEALTEDEQYLIALLEDESGVDQAEFLWTDDTRDDGVFRCYDYQVAWYRDQSKFSIDQCARAVGKSVGIQLRAFSFPFNNPGEEMLITAPESIHLEPVTRYVEDRLLGCRLSRDMLKSDSKTNGIRHRPFEAKFTNGAKIGGRIPQKDGKGVKGQHPKKLEMDEAQDYPEAGWIELTETLKYGQEGATWRAHGVTRGVRDYFYKLTQPESGWTVHRITAMHRPDWTPEERSQKAEVYGGRHSPDYRRNILGQHGDAQNPLFVLTRLMACVDSNQSSPYNTDEYLHLRVTAERVAEAGGDIAMFLEFPQMHLAYERVWAGMDVGMTNHPSEILIFGEVARSNSGKAFVKKDGVSDPDVRLKTLARVHLERISAPDQRAVLKAIYDHYRPRAIAMDKTGLGLPIYQEIINGRDRGFAKSMRGYNFSEKIVVGYEQMPSDVRTSDYSSYAMMGNVLEYSSDTLRLLVDRQQLILPWDIEMLREFQGQTYVVKRSQTNPYGKKQFNQGKFHTLDAARMAALAFTQETIEALRPKVEDFEPVLDAFVM